MSASINNNKVFIGPDDFILFQAEEVGVALSERINDQIKQTQLRQVNYISSLKDGLFLLTIKKNRKDTPSSIKKISDKAQYSLLPAKNDQRRFCRLSLTNVKNHCRDHLPSSSLLYKLLVKSPLPCHIYFFYDLLAVTDILHKEIKKAGLFVRETLTNRTQIISDGNFNFPLHLAKIPSLALFADQCLVNSARIEIASIQKKLLLLPHIFQSIKQSNPHIRWTKLAGKMCYKDGKISRHFDYASFLDDTKSFDRHDALVKEYLNCFEVSSLDTSSSFPTVCVRSPVYLKARPNCLSQVENGYVIVAAKESLGKQSQLNYQGKKPAKAFSLWIKRASRHVFRHKYRARVVFPSDGITNIFSLVGDQVATCALFPCLIKKVFETLEISAPKSVRLIAHNEDVITVAHDTASWVDINEANEKSTSLFSLIANDGSDPLSLFEQIVLPDIGFGQFELKVVPEKFFDLINTAHAMEHSLPPGHSHYLMGLAYRCIQECGLAVKEFEWALRFDSGDPDFLHALGNTLLEIGQTEESLLFLRQAAKKMPEDAEVANSWGRSSILCGNVADAIEAFERAVKICPASAEYFKNLGDSYIMARKPIEALDALHKALQCDPNNAEAHVSLAHVHIASGERTLAKKHALLAYKENPFDVNVANLILKLTDNN